MDHDPATAIFAIEHNCRRVALEPGFRSSSAKDVERSETHRISPLREGWQIIGGIP